jgi:KaiC/GvpD/RAD55 family RecA-like ATPase
LSYLQSKLPDYGSFGTDVIDLTDKSRLEKYRRRREAYNMGQSIGIPTGFKSLDGWFHGGLQGGELYLILGATGVGKTWTGLTMATSAWKAGYIPAYFLLEGAPEAAGYRFDSLLANVPNSELFVGSMDYDEYEDTVLTAIRGETSGQSRPFWLATMGSQAEYTVGHIWQLCSVKRPAIVVVDYLTLMTVPGQSVDDWRVAATISRQLASLAVRLDVPVVAVVQGTKGAIGKSTLGLDDVAVAYAITRPASNVIGVSNQGGGVLKLEHLKGRHTSGSSTSGNPAFYVKTDWNVGTVKEDNKRVL